MEDVSRADRETVEAVEGVHLTALAAGENASVQHFRFEPGAAVPEHDHPHEQVGYLVRGTLTFSVEGEEYTVEAGGSYSLPGGQPHAAENRTDGPVEGIDVFSPPRTDPDWAD